MKSRLFHLLQFTFLIASGGCVEPFSPPEISEAESFLVVDGFLNVGSDTSTVRLSRTQNLSDDSTPVSEIGAKVIVEGSNGNFYEFTESKEGVYILLPHSIDRTEQFRIKVVLSNGKTYLSDYSEVKNTPEIDSLTYKVNGEEGVQIYINTHDPANEARYYRWEYDETWEYTSAYLSGLEVVEGDIRPRQEGIFTCWRSLYPKNILLGTSIKLSQDILQNARLTYIPASSGKLYIKYSILVRQYAISQEAFGYWTALAKTTETTGSIFDPLPSLVKGNIHCITDAGESVFGFFSVGEPKEKRLFITPRLGSYPYCTAPDTLDRETALTTDYLIISEIPIGSYLAITPYCADCRMQGGSNKKPVFWE